jgi:hypothetical protein
MPILHKDRGFMAASHVRGFCFILIAPENALPIPFVPTDLDIAAFFQHEKLS